MYFCFIYLKLCLILCGSGWWSIILFSNAGLEKAAKYGCCRNQLLEFGDKDDVDEDDEDELGDCGSLIFDFVFLLFHKNDDSNWLKAALRVHVKENKTIKQW